jgi:hypothetical protein
MPQPRRFARTMITMHLPGASNYQSGNCRALPSSTRSSEVFFARDEPEPRRARALAQVEPRRVELRRGESNRGESNRGEPCYEIQSRTIASQAARVAPVLSRGAMQGRHLPGLCLSDHVWGEREGIRLTSTSATTTLTFRACANEPGRLSVDGANSCCVDLPVTRRVSRCPH